MSRRVNLADMLDGEPLDEPTKAAPRPPVLSTADIAANPDNPRGAVVLADEEFKDLVTSVQEVGIIAPLTVCTTEAFLRHNPGHAQTLGGHPYVVVAGHRRLAAAQLAGLLEVPAYVNDSAAEDPLVWAVAENLLRVGLTPIQEANALRVLTDPPPAGRGMPQTKAARGIGKTQGFVSQRIALLNLVPELQQKVAAGELGLKAARSLVSLPADRQLTAFEQQAAGYYPVMAPEPDPAPAVPQPTAAAPYYPVIGESPAEAPTDIPSALAAPSTPSASSAPARATTTTTTAAPAPAAPLPEQRATAPRPPSLDWHDIPAFAAAIGQALSADEVNALAEALIANLA